MSNYGQAIIQTMYQTRLAEEARKRAEEARALDPISILGGAVAGFFGSGMNPVGALLGAAGGLAHPKGEGTAGQAGAALGGYQLGGVMKKNAIQEAAQAAMNNAKTQEEWLKGAMQLYPEEVVKGVFSKPLVQMGEGGEVQTQNMLNNLFKGNASAGVSNDLQAIIRDNDLQAIIRDLKAKGVSDAQILLELLK